MRATALVLAMVLLTVHPGFSEGQSIYAEIAVGDVVEHNVDCAATILALGDGSDLAALIATFFMLDAARTLHAVGGWKDEQAAQQSVQSRAVASAQDRLIGLDNTRSRQELLEHQTECVFDRFSDQL